jgi:hypothetical protein
LKPPLIFEHCRYGRLETFADGQEKVIVHFLAAGPLGIQKGGIEKCASRIGINLDEFGTIRRKVKVIPHEDAKRAEVMARNLGRGRQNPPTVRLKTADPFNRLNRGQHTQEVFLRDKGGCAGKQMRMCKLQFRPHFFVASANLQMLQKHVPVERHAKTLSVEPVA